MAKNSFILASTRGRVGNVVVRQQEGVTVLSQHQPVVKNPQTAAQALQRMRMAAVTKFYSPLSTMLQESFEGMSTRRSYNEFTSQALRRLADTNYGYARAWGFTPVPAMVSRGSLRPVNAVMARYSLGLPSLGNTQYDENMTIGQLSSTIISALGAADGWQLSVLLVVEDAGIFFPVYFRLRLDSTDARLVNDVVPANVSIYGDDGVSIDWGGTQQYLAAGAVILSCYERGKWRRSTEYLSINGDWTARLEGAFDAAVADYTAKDNNTQPDGDVYLDGVTRGSSSTGGGGINFDPSTFAVQVGGAASQLHPVSVGWSSSEGQTLLGLRLSDGVTRYLSGNDHMATYRKFWTSNKEVVVRTNEQIPNAQMVTPAETSTYDLFQWVSQQLGWPMDTFFEG